MTHILHIDASAHFNTSKSRQGSAKIISDLNGFVTRRDLTIYPLPQVNGAWADARLSNPATRSTDEAQILELSDILVAELQAANTIVIGTPIYNFSAPASLKAWMDLVARPGVTFTYSDKGPKGLLDGKKAIIVIASGGTPIGSDVDFLTPHLKFFLKFIGITDVETIAATNLISSL